MFECALGDMRPSLVTLTYVSAKLHPVNRHASPTPCIFIAPGSAAHGQPLAQRGCERCGLGAVDSDLGGAKEAREVAQGVGQAVEQILAGHDMRLQIEGAHDEAPLGAAYLGVQPSHQAPAVQDGQAVVAVAAPGRDHVGFEADLVAEERASAGTIPDQAVERGDEDGARGAVSGTQALALKMVDGLGGLEDAINAAAKLAKLPTPPSVERPRRRFSFIELLRNELGLPAPGSLLRPALPVFKTPLYLMD